MGSRRETDSSTTKRRRARPLAIREWQIFHTYSTYFDSEIPDLDAAAHALVEAGLAECAVTSDGGCVWRHDGAIRAGEIELDLRASYRRGEIRLPEGIRGFAAEAAYEGAMYSYWDAFHFGEGFELPLPYVRAFMPECVLYAKHAEVAVYPMLKLYASGVVSVSLRVFGPNRPVQAEEFIREYVNAFQMDFARAVVPPALSKLAPLAYAVSESDGDGFLGRLRITRKQRVHAKAVRELSYTRSSGSFSFEGAPLSKDARGTASETYSRLALTILHVAAYVTSAPKTGWRYVLRGPGHVARIGGRWVGRPHVHLIRFSNQGPTSQDVEREHGDTLSAILAGVHPQRKGVLSRFLPKNARPWGDFGAYLAENGTLWVYARSGFDMAADEPTADANRGSFVYAHQSQVEMLELGDGLHRLLAERARNPSVSAAVVSQTQQQLLDLKLAMAESARFGEVRDLLASGWAAWGVDALRDVASSSLDLRRTAITEREAERSNRLARYLAIVAGVLTVPPLADSLVEPLWKWANWWPANEPLAEPFYAAVAVAAVTPFLLVGYFFARK